MQSDPIFMEFDKWVSSRGNGKYAFKEGVLTPIQQIREEITGLVETLLTSNLTDSALEIGLGAYGGSHMLWRLVFNKVVTIENDANVVENFKQREQLDDRSLLVVGDSKQVHNQIQGEFSFLHIDGDHTYDGVKSDYINYNKFVRQGGIIAFHDALLPPVKNFLYDLESGLIDGHEHKLKYIIHSTYVGYAYEIKSNESIINTIDMLKRDGAAILPEKIGKSCIDEFNYYLSNKPTWNKHVKFHATGPGTANSSSTSWSMEDVILAPHLFDMSINMTNYAEEYFGTTANMYSINAFTANPIDGPSQQDIQEFHRDRDDSSRSSNPNAKFVGLFIYCNDVLTEEDGPHQFVRTSHLDHDRMWINNRQIVSIFGEAGTIFLADTWGLHRGLRPKKNPRTVFWARWSIQYQPSSYDHDHLSPVSSVTLGNRYPNDPKLRNAIKLVAR